MEVESLKRQLDQALRDLESERENHARTTRELEDVRNESEDFRSKWKLVTKQLNRIQARNQPVSTSQLMDQDLIQRVMQLRYEINSFCNQHFCGRISRRATEEAVNRMAIRLPVSGYDLHEYLTSREWRPLVIRCYLWVTFTENVFGRFRWAPKTMHRAMFNLEDLIDPIQIGQSNSSTISENFHKHCTWRANTVELVMQSLDTTDAHSQLSKDAVSHYRSTKKQIFGHIASLSDTNQAVLYSHFDQVLKQAMNLDCTLLQQRADIRWTWPMDPEHEPSPLFFSDASMTLDLREREADSVSGDGREGRAQQDQTRRNHHHHHHHQQNKVVTWVLAPGLTKKRYGERGPNAGLGKERNVFNDDGGGDGRDETVRYETQLLVKMEVSCRTLVRIEPAPETSRPRRRSNEERNTRATERKRRKSTGQYGWGWFWGYS